jgi:dienelactone hydrolase
LKVILPIFVTGKTIDARGDTMVKWKIRHFFVAAGLVAAVVANVVCAQVVGRIEIVPLPSMTLSSQQFLLGEKAGKAVTLAGELRLPRGKFGEPPSKLPAVVLAHGSGGVDATIDRWVSELNGMGVATFVVDSYSGRGINRTAADQSQLSSLAMVYDAYRALDWLAQHARIDSSRIAVMGFSKGATASLYSAMDRFQNAYGSDKAQFAAHIAFYAPCIKYLDDEKVSTKPIRIFHGELDDWLAAAPCRAYAERLSSAGKDVRIFIYPDALHSFDAPGFPTAFRVPQAQQFARCRLEEAPNGILNNAESGKPFSFDDVCVGRGATVGYNPQAHAAAINEVKDFLKVAFRLQ